MPSGPGLLAINEGKRKCWQYERLFRTMWAIYNEMRPVILPHVYPAGFFMDLKMLTWSPSVYKIIVAHLTARAPTAINAQNSILHICINDYVSLKNPYVPPVLCAWHHHGGWVGRGGGEELSLLTAADDSLSPFSDDSTVEGMFRLHSWDNVSHENDKHQSRFGCWMTLAACSGSLIPSHRFHENIVYR